MPTKKVIKLDKHKMPKHIAISIAGNRRWAKKNDKLLRVAFDKSLAKIEELIDYQTRFDIPIMTLYILSSAAKQSSNFIIYMDALESFFAKLKENKKLVEEKIKISIIGKWYALPTRVVDKIKDLISETKDYDQHFLNLCINYDGREELVDAMKIIARTIKMGKIDEEAINDELIKENIYTSYFIPPQLMIITADRKTRGFLMWDSTDTVICFSDKYFPDFDKNEFYKALAYYQKMQQ